MNSGGHEDKGRDDTIEVEFGGRVLVNLTIYPNGNISGSEKSTSKNDTRTIGMDWDCPSPYLITLGLGKPRRMI